MKLDEEPIVADHGGELILLFDEVQHDASEEFAVAAHVLDDTVPPLTTFQSATQGGTLSGGSVSWNIGMLPPGASGSVQFTVRVDSPLGDGTIISNGSYSIASNETGAISGPPVTTTVTSAPVLAISVVDSPDPVVSGGDITYVISYSNSGNANTSGAVITDAVPADTTFVSATGGGTHSGGVVTWSLGNVNVGTSGSVQLVVRVGGSVADGTLITNSGYQIDSNETETEKSPERNTRLRTRDDFDVAGHHLQPIVNRLFVLLEGRTGAPAPRA